MAIFLIFNILLALSVIIVLLVKTFNGQIDFSKPERSVIEYVAICGYAILSFFFIVSILFMIDRFLTTKKLVLNKIEEFIVSGDD